MTVDCRKEDGLDKRQLENYLRVSNSRESTCDSKKVRLGNFTGIKVPNPSTRDKMVNAYIIPEAEWAYILEGKVRVTALDTEGGNFIDEVEKGDLWYFPAGHPHSLQGLSATGCEFLLIFDDGNFSEDSTFLLTDWLGMPSPITLLRAP